MSTFPVIIENFILSGHVLNLPIHPQAEQSKIAQTRIIRKDFRQG